MLLLQLCIAVTERPYELVAAIILTLELEIVENALQAPHCLSTFVFVRFQAVDSATELAQRVKRLQQAVDVARRAFVDQAAIGSGLIADFHIHEEITGNALLLPFVKIGHVKLEVTLMEYFRCHDDLDCQALREPIRDCRRVRE